jgi:hypothetical protein
MAQEAVGTTDGQLLSSGALNAAVAAHVSAADRQRTELSELLSNPEVREVASNRGIDMARVESAAAGLSDAELMEVAPLVAAAEPMPDLGGGTITISVVAVIIILLLLILVT